MPAKESQSRQLCVSNTTLELYLSCAWNQRCKTVDDGPVQKNMHTTQFLCIQLRTYSNEPRNIDSPRLEYAKCSHASECTRGPLVTSE